MAILNRRTSQSPPIRSIVLASVFLSATVVSPLVPSMVTAETVTAESMTAEMATPELTTAELPLVFNAASTGGFEGYGRPASRSSGGSRGNCQTLLVALVPGEGTLSDDCSQPTYSSTALTTESMPTLWFYIPEQDSPRQAELALLDDNRQAIAFETLSLPAESGVVGIPLGYELDLNQSYRWLFSISPETNPSRLLTVEGIVRRVSPDAELMQHLEAAEGGRDRILYLAQGGIWHDALTELIMLRQQQPEDITLREDWRDFLVSVGLDLIVDSSIK